MGVILNVRMVLILVVSAVFIGLMIVKKFPTILALPILGVIVTVTAGVPFLKAPETDGQTIMGSVIGQGVLRLAGTIVVTIFGGTLTKVIQKQGISGVIIRKAVELAGDKPYAIAFVLTAATALIPSAIGGAGPAIIASTIVIPLMLSTGTPDITVASLVLLGINIGGLFNVSNHQFYVDTIGMDTEIIKSGSLTIGILSAVAIILYIMLNVDRRNTRNSWVMPAKKVEKEVGVSALLAPVAPTLLAFLFKLSAELSLLTAIIYTILVTKPKQIIQTASGPFVEGIQNVSGVITLMTGIGTLLSGVPVKETTVLIQPLVQAVMPSSPLVYVVLFTLLSPLALYRGPSNMYGLGPGLANIMMAASTLSPAVIDMALRAAGVVQEVSDLTSIQNVIVADSAKVDVNAILKSTLPYTILITLGTSIYTVCSVL